MKKNFFIDFNVNKFLKQFGLVMGIFIISFGFINAIRNAGSSYAVPIMPNKPFEVSCSSTIPNLCCPYSRTYKYSYNLYYDSTGLDNMCTREINPDAQCNSQAVQPEKKLKTKKGNYVCAVNSVWQIKFKVEENEELIINGDIKTDKLVNGIYTEEILFTDNEGGKASNYKMQNKNKDNFIGWCPNNNKCSENSVIKENDKLYNVASVILYPIFKKATKYSAYFNQNTGKLVGKTPVSCYLAENASSCEIEDIPTAEKEGHKFIGWSQKYDCSETPINPNKITLTKSSTTYYACYEKQESSGKKTYLANFDANGGKLNGNAVKKCILDDKASSCIIEGLPTAEKEEHKFIGWSQEKNCVNPINLDKLELNKIKTTYYACYEKQDVIPGPDPGTSQFTAVFYDYNYGFLKEEKCTVKAGEKSCRIKLPENPDSSKNFTGWGNKPNCISGDNGNVDISENSNFYPCSENESGETKFIKYIATFKYSNGENKITECYAAEGRTCSVIVPHDDVKSGYKFNGWGDNISCENGKSSDKLEINSDKTFYSCFLEDNISNPNTGSTLLYIAYLVGILALGYTGYYSYKVIKSRNE